MRLTIITMFSLLFLFSESDLKAQEYNPVPGQEYKIISIFFAGGRYYISEEHRQRVRDFLSNEILQNYEIHIHSHTDNRGGVEFNLFLSRMRSEATYEFLKDEGIPLYQLYIEDHGLIDPQFNNQTWEGRSKNRRVDIVLWPLPS